MTAKKKPAKKPAGAKRFLFVAILIVAAGAFIFSGIKLISIYSSYRKGSDTYDWIEDLSRRDPVTPTSGESQPEERPEDVYFNVAALQEVNSDAAGYLYAKDVLSYPVVQGTDNSYYLKHLFDGTPNDCGCVFIDCNIPEGFEARNCILYGHDMKDGSMFAHLHYYADEEYYQSHKEFHVFTEDHHYIYKVLSAFTTKTDGYVYTHYFSGDEDFVDFLYLVAGSCPYETDYGELTADRKVITMSTCVGNNDNLRFVVVLIRDREIFNLS